MPRIRDQAIVLREMDWSETSQVVTLLTHQHGKVRGLAKGSKRLAPSSIARFSGGIDPLTVGEVVCALRPSTGLATVTEWDLQQPCFHLRQDLEAQHTALYAADLADALLAEQDPHPAVFQALRTLLAALAEAAGREAALLDYQWSALHDCGYRPELGRDVRDGGALPDEATFLFDPIAGGLARHQAGEATAGAGEPIGRGPWPVRRETVELLRRLAEGAPARPAQVPDATVRRANRLLCAYARAVLDRELPTMALIL